ncbi:MAG: norR 15 [Firmicutes bacterium]|nr:norR 15 [Bacillota bacterium]
MTKLIVGETANCRKLVKVNMKNLYDQFTTLNNLKLSERFIVCLLEEERQAKNFNRIKKLETIQETINNAKKFNILANKLHDGIHIVNSKGVVVYVNQGFKRVSGFGEEIIGFHISDLAARGYQTEIAGEVLKTKKLVNTALTSPITKVNVTTAATPVFYEDGSFMGVIIIDRDMTELEQMQAAIIKSQNNIKIMEDEIVIKDRALTQLTKASKNSVLIGYSAGMQQVRELIGKIAPLDATVLITGETGTGKENVANEINKCSTRCEKPFVKVNCSAIPSNLIEAELFGYEKGAFTGANTTGKMGYFELAQKGTILLDEIGELPLEVQPKLLRVIQQKELIRVGATKPVELDVRIIAATNRNLYQMALAGTFRMNLYYRLNLFPIDIPPLRARNEDIPVLVKHFFSIYNAKYTKAAWFLPDALSLLYNYSWPGNIRELENIIERMVIISKGTDAITKDELSPLMGIAAVDSELNSRLTLAEKVEALEKREIISALAAGKTVRETAKILGINASNVVRKMQKYKITRNS